MNQSDIDQIEHKLETLDSDLYQEICLNINEVAFSEERSHGIKGDNGSIDIFEVTSLDREGANHEITGTFWFYGDKYWFEVQVGNWNGFEWMQLSRDE